MGKALFICIVCVILIISALLMIKNKRKIGIAFICISLCIGGIIFLYITNNDFRLFVKMNTNQLKYHESYHREEIYKVELPPQTVKNYKCGDNEVNYYCKLEKKDIFDFYKAKYEKLRIIEDKNKTLKISIDEEDSIMVNIVVSESNGKTFLDIETIQK